MESLIRNQAETILIKNDAKAMPQAVSRLKARLKEESCPAPMLLSPQIKPSPLARRAIHVIIVIYIFQVLRMT